MAALTTGQYVKAIGGAQIDTDGIKRYVALLTQSGTDAPVATVLENTLGGTVVWTRNDVGDYSATLAGAFPANKVACLVSNSAEGATFGLFRQSDNALALYSLNGDGTAPDFPITVDIRVYP